MTLNPANLLFLSNGTPGGIGMIEIAGDLRSVRFTVSGDSGLEAGLMTVIATRSVKDIAGNGLPSDFFSSFAVEDADPYPSTFAIHETRPRDHATAIPANAKISLLTNAPFWPDNLEDAFFVTVNGQLIGGELESLAGDRIVRFTPDQDFPAGATVQLTPNEEFVSTLDRAPILNALFPISFQVRPSPAAGPPTLVGVSPNVPFDIEKTPQGNPSNSRILARFSEALNPASIDANSVFLSGPEPITDPIPGAAVVTPEGDTVELVPSQPLLVNATYELHVTSAVQDLQGQSLPVGIVHSFTIRDGADGAAPTVYTVSPAENFTGAPVNTLIKARFTEPVNPVTVRDSTFRLLRSGQPISGSFLIASDLLRVTLAPLEYLAPSTAYTVQISGLQDAAGNPVQAKTWTFTTGSEADTVRPDRISALPEGSEAGTNARLILRFNEPMDPTGIPLDFLKQNLTPVSGTLGFSLDGTAIQFTPSSLQPNSQHHSSFEDEDLAGNPGGDSEHSFATGTGADFLPPDVMSTSPANGATNVSPFTTVSVRMSELIDPFTVNSQNVQLYDGLVQVPAIVQLYDDFREDGYLLDSGAPKM